jgi:hypothetical protein
MENDGNLIPVAGVIRHAENQVGGAFESFPEQAIAVPMHRRRPGVEDRWLDSDPRVCQTRQLARNTDSSFRAFRAPVRRCARQ